MATEPRRFTDDFVSAARYRSGMVQGCLSKTDISGQETRNMMRKYLTAALLVLPLLAACESYSPSKQDVGMAAGAVVGGVLGHQVGNGTGQTVATIGGAALGAFLGSRVGARMDRSD
jgi:outer membrane lipoprotein SlyB